MSNENARIEKIERTHGKVVCAFGSHVGSVMLEYVIIVGALAVGLTLFMNQAFYDPLRGFGPLGQAFVASCQRTFAGLSLPIP